MSDSGEANGHILIVDDEECNRELLEDLLGSFGYTCVTAENGHEALVKLNSDTNLVLMDVMMPIMTGFEAVRQIRRLPEHADVPIVMVTALNTREDRLCAVEAGANDFISKPVDKTELRVRTASLLKMKAAQDSVRRYQEQLEATVSERTAQLRKTLQDLEGSRHKTYEGYVETIRRLAIASEYKDNRTGHHLARVSHYCALLGRALQLPAAQVELLFHASVMHDVGKLGIPDAILTKPGSLTPQEREMMQQHARIGAQILNGSESDLLSAGEVIALSHHEKWDGTGYPNGLSGEDIPLMGRICAIADVFDALTTSRSYKSAFLPAKAYEILREGRGLHFDPALLDLFLGRADEVNALHLAYVDEAESA